MTHVLQYCRNLELRTTKYPWKYMRFIVNTYWIRNAANFPRSVCSVSVDKGPFQGVYYVLLTHLRRTTCYVTGTAHWHRLKVRWNAAFEGSISLRLPPEASMREVGFEREICTWLTCLLLLQWIVGRLQNIQMMAELLMAHHFK